MLCILLLLHLQFAWFRQFVYVSLSSWELVCVFQLVCLTVGNSHWLRNNYPYDLNIIQLISFISQVITHNRVRFPLSYERRCRNPLPLALAFLPSRRRASIEKSLIFSTHLGWFMSLQSDLTLFSQTSSVWRRRTKWAQSLSLYGDNRIDQKLDWLLGLNLTSL